MTQPASVAGRWRRTGDTVWRGFAGRLLILPPGAPDPLEVTGPGLALWHVLADPRSVEEIVDLLTDAFAAPRAQVEADIVPALAQLAELGAAEQLA